MKTFFNKIGTLIATHKKTSILVALVLVGGGYYAYTTLTSTSADPTYVLGTAATDTVVASLTGTGQVSTNRTLVIKPLVSGNITYVGVTAGQSIQSGDIIADIDNTTAEKAVRDAEASLESAQLSLQKIQEPTDALTLLQAQDAVTQSQANLATDYDNGFNDTSNAFLDMPSIMTGLDSILHGTDVSGNSQWNLSYYSDAAQQYETSADTGTAAEYAADTEQKFEAAETAYTANFNDYKNTARTSDTATIQNLIDETYTTSELVADAVKSAQNLIQYYQQVTTSSGHTPIAKSNSELASLSTYTTEIVGHVSDLLTTKTSIDTDTAAIPEKQESLKELQAGTDPVEIQSAQLAVTQQQNALQDAKDNLADYYITAPFSGTIADIDVNVGDPADPSTTIATLIDNEQVVDITLNEVDAAKVVVGDKATMTFDAIDGLVLTGKVISMDTVGTVTQGVVNYTATIGFDSMDPRVKSGMSVTASIITTVHADVLTVPASAVKSSGSTSYVLAFDPAIPEDASDADSGTAQTVVSATPPQKITVTTGISDDTNTEITSGLTVGEQIVVKTIMPSTTSAASTAPSILSATGAGGGRGGAGGGTAGALRSAAATK